MEWQGEIRRGYFIEGLSGIQFALPEAIELLSDLPAKRSNVECNIISTSDPALPFGGNIEWKISRIKGEKLEIRRAPGNHLAFLGEEPVLYSENYGNRLWFVKLLKNKELEIIFNTFKNWLRLPDKIRARKKIEIEFIDGESAVNSDLVDFLFTVGFEKEGSSIVLWPSGL
jgi:ATP-dependent Lhr-like helicase